MTITLLWVNYAEEGEKPVYTLVLAADDQLLSDDPGWWDEQLAQLAADGILDHPHRTQQLQVGSDTLAHLFASPPT